MTTQTISKTHSTKIQHHKSPHQKVSGTEGECNFPPYRITFDRLTYDVGRVDRQERKIDDRHYNAYLLVPKLVYHLSTKLKNKAIHNRIGQPKEVKLIRFLTRYGYATRAAPHVYSMVHMVGAQTCRM
jgi:hypothetical protein